MDKHQATPSKALNVHQKGGSVEVIQTKVKNKRSLSKSSTDKRQSHANYMSHIAANEPMTLRQEDIVRK